MPSFETEDSLWRNRVKFPRHCHYLIIITFHGGSNNQDVSTLGEYLLVGREFGIYNISNCYIVRPTVQIVHFHWKRSLPAFDRACSWINCTDIASDAFSVTFSQNLEKCSVIRSRQWNIVLVREDKNTICIHVSDCIISDHGDFAKIDRWRWKYQPHPHIFIIPLHFTKSFWLSDRVYSK
jgi:hypothetical protein